jgi:hypothetical protein
MSRASKQLGTNVTKKLMSEMQALIAFACYDSPAIAQGGDSMTQHSMAESMTALYFGGDDPEIISYLDQFINGLHRFTGLFTSSEPDEFGQIILTIPQKLHRHVGVNIFVGPTSITKELLSKKNFANNEKIAGRTLLKEGKGCGGNLQEDDGTRYCFRESVSRWYVSIRYELGRLCQMVSCGDVERMRPRSKGKSCECRNN